MSNLQLSLLLVSSGVDFMVVGRPFCYSCFEKKTGAEILRDFPLNLEDYKDLLRSGLPREARIKCECPPELPEKKL